MGESWIETSAALTSSDPVTLTRALQRLCVAASPDVAAAAIPQCIALTAHAELRVRAHAFAALAAVAPSGGGHVAQDVARCVCPPPPLSAAGDDHVLLHQSVCALAAHLHRVPAAVDKWTPLVAHLVTATAAESDAVAAAACRYWAAVRAPPAGGAATWQTAVLARLAVLVRQLCDAMVYRPALAETLERRQVGDTTDDDPDDPDDLNGPDGPDDSDGRALLGTEADSHPDSHPGDLRNYAALAFERLCRTFRTESVAVFRPILKKGLRDDADADWPRIEATVLALAAMTRALGQTRELDDPLPRLLALHDHRRPLVRAMASFAAPLFAGAHGGRAADFSGVLRRTLDLLPDANREVQQMALQSLSAQIGGECRRDVAPYARRVATALAKLTTDGATRPAYYECVCHLFGRAGAALDARLTARLLRPLVSRWVAMATPTATTAETTATDGEDLIQLSQTLCVCAKFSGTLFAQHNTVVFEKVTEYMDAVMEDVSPDARRAVAVTTRVVAHLDLLSALFEGQRSELCGAATHYDVVSRLLRVLRCDRLRGLAEQSAWALLGHVCRDCYTAAVADRTDDVVTAATAALHSPTPAVVANALWTLTHVAAQCPAQPPPAPLLALADPLTALFTDTSGDAHVVLHAAVAVSHLAARWRTAVAPAATAEPALLHMCALLLSHLPHGLDPAPLLRNLCALLAAPPRRPARLWAQFCLVALQAEPAGRLYDDVRTRLREARDTLGPNGWSRVAAMTGGQAAYALRRRYKLY